MPEGIWRNESGWLTDGEYVFLDLDTARDFRRTVDAAPDLSHDASPDETTLAS